MFKKKTREIKRLEAIEQEISCLRKRVNDMSVDLLHIRDAVQELQVYGSIGEAFKVEKLAKALGYTFVESKRVPSKYVKKDEYAG